MNNYVQQVEELLKDQLIAPKYLSFIMTTLNNLAITKNEEYLIHILGTPEEFVVNILQNNQHYEEVIADNEASDIGFIKEDNSSFIVKEFTESDNFIQHEPEDVKPPKTAKKLNKGKFYHTFNWTLLLAYRLLAFLFILVVFWNSLIIFIKFHSHEVNTILASSIFAFIACVLFIDYFFEQIRNIINSLLQDRYKLANYIVKLIISLIIIILIISIINLSYQNLLAYLPEGTDLSNIRFLINIF